MDPLSLFLAAPPGLELQLLEEARERGFDAPVAVPGGVEVAGGWAAAMRANLHLAVASRVLARLASFRAVHPAQLDKRARKVDWRAALRADVPVRIEATSRRSRVYHAGAVVSRIAGAVEAVGIPVRPDADDAVRLVVRLEDDLCTISVDTSGAPLHRRGSKQAVGKAPIRDTMAAGLLRAAGWDGTSPVVDPMCGSGTFVLEAVARAADLPPGRGRSFAFERLARFDAASWDAMRRVDGAVPKAVFAGSDRDAGAVAAAAGNAARAGVAGWTRFDRHAVSDAAPPEGPPGLVIVNPPYGGRVGKGPLFGLYAAFGRTMRERFAGWRVAMVTSDAGLARTCDLPWDAPGPILDNGGIKVRLWQARR